jgi:hypothetical protein
VSDSNPPSDRFSTLVTVLIALVSTVIALVASQAATASGNAGEAQHEGVQAEINLQRVRGAAFIEIARNQRLFADYATNARLEALAGTYRAEARQAGNAAHENRLADDQARFADDSAAALRYIDGTYLTWDGERYTAWDADTYLIDTEQDAAYYQDIDLAKPFAEAAVLRRDSLALNASLLVWFLSLTFLTWAQISKSGLRYLWLLVGVLAALGIVAAYALFMLVNQGA